METMETYIKQLIEDLEAALQTVFHPLIYEDSEDYPKTTFEKLSGIEKFNFPPVEKLSQKQLQDLLKAIITFIESKKYVTNLFDSMPIELQYQLLLDKWTAEIEYVVHGLAGLDYCPEDPADCTIREFCGCCFEGDPADIPVYNGIYDDNGNKIDMLSVPMPDLCLSCESFMDDDWEENILCGLTRADRKEGEEFMCYAWRKRVTKI